MFGTKSASVDEVGRNPGSVGNRHILEEKSQSTLNEEQVAQIIATNKRRWTGLLLDWDKQVDLGYNYSEVPVLVKDHDGSVWDDGREKALLWNDDFQKLLHRAYPVVLNEYVGDVIADVTKERGNDFKLEEVYDSSRGFTRHWQIASQRLDDKYEIKDSFRKGDVVQVGVMARNGIASGTALGFDLYTYCVKCGNGSIARGPDLGSLALSHAGKREKLQQLFVDNFTRGFDKAMEFLQYYQAAARIRMTNKHLEQIYKATGISEKYFEKSPKVFDIEEQDNKDRKPFVDRLSLAKKDTTLWEGFNALTDPLWHLRGFEMQFTGVASRMQALNNQLVAIVKENGGAGGAAA